MPGRQLGTFSPTVVPALPATGRVGQQVFYAGAVWSFDGTAWSTPTPLSGRVVVTVPTPPRREFYATVAVTGLAVGDRVQAWAGSGTAGAKAADEFEMDVLDVWASVKTAGNLTLRLTSQTGPIVGVFPINYLKG